MFYFFALFADGTLAQSATIVGEGTFHDRVHTAAQRHERQSNGKKESRAQTTDIYTDIYKYINIYTAYFICHLIVCSGFAQESCIEFERLVHAQCEALIQAIHDRREYLLEAIRNDKDTKIRILKVCTRPPQLLSSSCLTVFFSFQDQQSNCTGKLQQTTGLIQFCIEALKETDSAAFLQVCILQGICWAYRLLTLVSSSTLGRLHVDQSRCQYGHDLAPGGHQCSASCLAHCRFDPRRCSPGQGYR